MQIPRNRLAWPAPDCYRNVLDKRSNALFFAKNALGILMSIYSELNIINTGDYTGMLNTKLQRQAKEKREVVMRNELAIKVAAEARLMQMREQRESDGYDDRTEGDKNKDKDKVVYVHDGFSSMIPMPLHLAHKYTTDKIKSLVKRKKWPPSDYKTPKGFENQRTSVHYDTLNESIRDRNEDYKGRPFIGRDNQAGIPLQKRGHRI